MDTVTGIAEQSFSQSYLGLSKINFKIIQSVIQRLIVLHILLRIFMAFSSLVYFFDHFTGDW